MLHADLSEIPQVAIAFMNRDHLEEASRVEAVRSALAAERGGRAEPGAVLEAWQFLVAFTREHFAREERAMEGTGFPGLAVHLAEHRLTLTAMDEEGAAFAGKGDLERLRRYVEEVLPIWLVQHVGTTDTIAARFLAERGAD